MNILAIDPGKNIGLSFYSKGKIVKLYTLTSVLALIDTIQLSIPEMIVIEDSRMQSYIFNDDALKRNKAVSLKIARDIGSVDCICSIIQDACETYEIKMISVSPKQKGKKLNGEQFKALTGWEGKTNPHTRDAAMVGWNYRNAAKVA